MKKIIVAVLALTIITGMSTIAMADEKKPDATDKGKAGIAYERGTVDIIDDDNPIIPKEWNFLTNRDIDFGEHDVFTNMTEQKYASWMEHRTKDTDYVGIIVSNGTSDPGDVTVGIGPFMAGNDLVGRNATINGFELELVTGDFEARDEEEDGKKVTITNPHDHELKQPKGATVKSTHDKFNAELSYHSGKIDAGGEDEDPLTASVLSFPGAGVHAATWGGVLTVPANSITYDGEAQAIMTWNISIGRVIITG